MNYTKLGCTGLDVSRICLGCVGFGKRGTWIHDWVLDEDTARCYSPGIGVGNQLF